MIFSELSVLWIIDGLYSFLRVAGRTILVDISKTNQSPVILRGVHMFHHRGHCPQCGQIITPIRCRKANTLCRDILECPNCQARIWERRIPKKINTDTAAGQKLLEMFRTLMLNGRRHFQADLAAKDQEKE